MKVDKRLLEIPEGLSRFETDPLGALHQHLFLDNGGTSATTNKADRQRFVAPKGEAVAATTMLFAKRDASIGEIQVQAVEQTLTAGAPFPADQAQKITEILGTAITPSGLTSLYAQCLPGTTPVLRGVKVEDNKLSYSIELYDRAGERVGGTDNSIRRAEDGSLRLHKNGATVDPSRRGFGTMVKAHLKEVAMMRALSDHENTAIELAAGAAGQESVGPYFWALMGFDFIDDDERSNLIQAFEDMVKFSFAWDSPDLTSKWITDVQTIQQPRDLALYAPEGSPSFTIRMGDRTIACPIGKGFLLAGDRRDDRSLLNPPPWGRWVGQFRVNDRTGGGTRAAALYARRSLASASDKQARLTTEWNRCLQEGDLTQGLQLIEQFGGEEQIPTLKLLLARTDEKSDREAIQDTIVALGPDGLKRNLEKRIETSKKPLQTIKLLFEVTGNLAREALQEVIEASAPPKTEAFYDARWDSAIAVGILADAELSRQPEAVIDEAIGWLERYGSARSGWGEFEVVANLLANAPLALAEPRLKAVKVELGRPALLSLTKAFNKTKGADGLVEWIWQQRGKEDFDQACELDRKLVYSNTPSIFQALTKAPKSWALPAFQALTKEELIPAFQRMVKSGLEATNDPNYQALAQRIDVEAK